MRTISTIAAITLVFTATGAAAGNFTKASETPLEKLRLEAIQVPVEHAAVEAQVIEQEGDAAAASGVQQTTGVQPVCDATGQQVNGDRCVLVWKRADGERDVLTWIEPREAGSHRLPILGADGKLY